VLNENPDGVAEFFGFDTDGDNKPDNGMAVKLVYVLKPYVGAGKNIIAAKIDQEDNSIKVADESIKQKEEHLKTYQDKLKRKFAAMEQAISQTNSQKQWMKNQLGGMDKDSGGKD
jgi:flagellar hook-associated protein 2